MNKNALMGNVIVGQSGGPTAVINSSLAGVFTKAKELGLGTVYGMRHGIQGFLDGRYIDLDPIFSDPINIELLKRTPSSYLRSCRYKLPAVEKGNEIYEKLFRRLRSLNIKYFFYIGGNDSMDTISKMSDYAHLIGSDIRFVGIPKTIDNDLAITDHTPGFGSAAKYVAVTTKEVIQDAGVYDMKMITVIEIMGRNAGWLTGAAALVNGPDCDGVDLLYLPELPFDTAQCLKDVKALLKKKDSIIIAVSEGVIEKEGMNLLEESSDSVRVDAFGHKSLSGMARCIADYLGKEIGCKTRYVEYSSIQRSASHITSKTDINEALQCGRDAVKVAYNGGSGKMITLKRVSNDPYACITEDHDVHEIANLEKKVPRAWINKKGNFVTDEFLDYVRPLISGEYLPVFRKGIPVHILMPKE